MEMDIFIEAIPSADLIGRGNFRFRIYLYLHLQPLSNKTNLVDRRLDLWYNNKRQKQTVFNVKG